MSRERRFGPGLSGVTEAALEGGCPLPRTALAVVQGVPRHLEAHLLRLAAGAAMMGQSVDWLLLLQRDIETWLSSTTPQEDAALRLVLHPDSGLLSARLEPLPAPAKPYRLVLMPHPLGQRQADLSVMHKGLSGPWGIEVLSAARSLGAEDALLLWSDGSVAETAIAAVGVEMGGVLRIPPPPGRVASLAERLDLPRWVESRNLSLEMRDIPQSLAREGRLWCMNALRGIWPATLL